MSRRKDRERLLALKGKNPDYPGFRGYEHEPDRQGSTPLATAVCTVCGRKRNVPVGTLQEVGEPFVCLSCQEKTEAEQANVGAVEEAGATEAEEKVAEVEEETAEVKRGQRPQPSA